MAGRIVAAYERLLVGLGALSGLIIATMAVLITADVLLRNAGIANMPWLLELSEYALYVATFIAAPWVLSLGSHVRVDLVVTSVPPAVRRMFEIAADLLGGAISATIGWYGLRVVMDSHARGDMIYKELVVPEWWLFVFIPFGSLLLAIEFLRRLVRAIATPEPLTDSKITEGF